ncbi:GIY-YIG nuclease family protein [Pseudomonadota bacterium]
MCSQGIQSIKHQKDKWLMSPRAHNSNFAEKIGFRQQVFESPVELYRLAKPKPKVSLKLFLTRLGRQAKKGALSEVMIHNALYLTSEDYKRQYRVRKTWIEVEGDQIDLRDFYRIEEGRAAVSYSAFRQRLIRFRNEDSIDFGLIEDALTLPNSDWISFYGGGRHRTFTYSGDLYPEYTGDDFWSVSAFMRTIGKYSDREIVWSRIKAGWSLDDALSIPTDFKTDRQGLIYKITRIKTGQIYVGLTHYGWEQRWEFHKSNARRGSTAKLAQAIREDGPEGFSVCVLETGIETPSMLKEREIYWVRKLKTLGPNGLNMAKPGAIGSSRGVPVKWNGEDFQSKKEASRILGERHNLAPHVVEKRLRTNQPLPTKARTHSDHPDAGSNLYRRWLALKRRHVKNVAQEWLDDYDQFKSDVEPSFSEGAMLLRIDSSKPWGPENWRWGSAIEAVESVHGKPLVVHGIGYASRNALARKFGISYSTLKHRLDKQGLSPEEAVEKPLGRTSPKKSAKS